MAIRSGKPHKRKAHHPYARPLISKYNDRRFVSVSKPALATVRHLIRANGIRWKEDHEWIHIFGSKMRRRPHWIPKIYVCVMPKHYWSVVIGLIFLSKQEKFQWKFNKNFKHFARPDKIVIHCRDLKQLKTILPSLRALLEGRQFHSMRYAANAKDLGLEKSGEGLYVGIDPYFLKMSWRYYSWLVRTALADHFKRQNRSVVTLKLLKALNLSAVHEGPRTLKPDEKNNKLVKEVIKQINAAIS